MVGAGTSSSNSWCNCQMANVKMEYGRNKETNVIIKTFIFILQFYVIGFNFDF